MNNYQTIISNNDLLYVLNKTNFYLPFKLYSNDEDNNILNRNLTKSSNTLQFLHLLYIIVMKAIVLIV